MKSTEFCYWLQGFFELSHLTTGIYAPLPRAGEGNPAAAELFLQKAHYQCIQNHIDLVKTFEGEKVLPFVHWLEGCIAGYLVSSAATDQHADYDSNAGHAQAVDITKEIQTRLNDLFEHVIDPSYGKDKQEAMNQAHSGPRPSRIHDTDRRLRC
jgi:hypothetical protein